MSNEEIIDEILHEAAAIGFRYEVIELAQKLLHQNPKMDRVDAMQLSLEHYKNNL